MAVAASDPLRERNPFPLELDSASVEDPPTRVDADVDMTEPDRGFALGVRPATNMSGCGCARNWTVSGALVWGE